MAYRGRRLDAGQVLAGHSLLAHHRVCAKPQVVAEGRFDAQRRSSVGVDATVQEVDLAGEISVAQHGDG